MVWKLRFPLKYTKNILLTNKYALNFLKESTVVFFFIKTDAFVCDSLKPFVCVFYGFKKISRLLLRITGRK